MNFLGDRRTFHPPEVFRARGGHSRPGRPRKHFVVEAVYLVSGIEGFHGGHRYSFAIPTKGQTINLRVGCEFSYDVSAPTPVTVQVRPRSDSNHRLVSETWSTAPSVP